MNRGMRHVISGAALAAGILLQAAPAFAQAPPWAQQDQRRSAPQHVPQQRRRQAGAAAADSSAASAAAASSSSSSRSRSRSRGRSPFQNVAGACGVPEQGHAAGRADRGLHRGDRRRQGQAGRAGDDVFQSRRGLSREGRSRQRDQGSRRVDQSRWQERQRLFQPRHGAARQGRARRRHRRLRAGDQARSAGTRRTTAPAATPITRSATTSAPSPT